MKQTLFATLFALPALLFSQDENLRNYDYLYLDNLRSVKFHIEGLYLSQPILNLRSSTPLTLSFDDLDGDYKNYTYSVVHCDANWQPSNLVESEYVEGFYEEDIRDYEYSFKVKSIYTHYQLAFPNEDMHVTKSGNYLLKIYENEDEKRLAITRRFMVVEPLVSFVADVTRPAIVSKGDTHQEIDFRMVHEDFEIRNPRQEITATILQNGRWDNAVTGIQPLFSKQKEQIFDYQDKIVFLAGKEFRYADLRSIRYGSPNIESISQEGGKYEAVLYRDFKRGNSTYLEYEDINGNFIIETRDDDVDDLESEYVSVLFSLASSERTDEDIYLFGGFTDWQLKPEFKMVYNPVISAYVGKVLLKQGYYTYLYAAVPKGKNELDFEATEGSWHEANNAYTILIYYRPFGGRYDRIIGATTFSSRL
ncbi:MAG: DUF5103 domain-containing protein [Bacteroidota bacterium]